jgi:hypothetical protein
MARYQILSQLLSVPRPVQIGEADTPAEAVRVAREFEKQGRKHVNIGDVESAQYISIEQFAAKHGVR